MHIGIYAHTPQDKNISPPSLIWKDIACNFSNMEIRYLKDTMNRFLNSK